VEKSAKSLKLSTLKLSISRLLAMLCLNMALRINIIFGMTDKIKLKKYLSISCHEFWSRAQMWIEFRYFIKFSSFGEGKSFSFFIFSFFLRYLNRFFLWSLTNYCAEMKSSQAIYEHFLWYVNESDYSTAFIRTVVSFVAHLPHVCRTSNYCGPPLVYMVSYFLSASLFFPQ